MAQVFPPWSARNLQDVVEERLQSGEPTAAPASAAFAPPRKTVDAAAMPPYEYPASNNQCRDSRDSIVGNVAEILKPLDGVAAVSFRLQCPNDREFVVRVRSTTSFQPLQLYDRESRGIYPASKMEDAAVEDNEIYKKVMRFIKMDSLVLVTGVMFETGSFDAAAVYLFYDLSGDEPTLVFEKPDWWRDQICQLTDSWLTGLFSNPDVVDWSRYRTNVGITFGEVDGKDNQEVATLSRLIYGLASAYHLTGNQRYLKAAASGIEYQRANFKLSSADGRSALWTSSRDGKAFQQTSPFPDDKGTIPLYEQIYALAGLTQYYRITLDPEVYQDIKETVNAFLRYYYDDGTKPGGQKGFFSHIDFATKSPFAESLNNGTADNIAKKNWNSVGDHIPAYLINLILSLENGHDPAFKETCIKILKECTELIVEKFVDKGFEQFEEDKSRVPLVPERFHRDWSLDTTYSWQQDRGIAGHNCKIVWNLHRVANYLQSMDRPLSERAAAAADKLLEALIKDGACDGFRGGVHDALERKPKNGLRLEFAWMDTRDFWQQEQAILAFLIAYGSSGKPQFLEYARTAQAYYNTFFLDYDQQSVYFRTEASGTSVTTGDYGQQASHAKSGYHTHENAFLSFLYNNCLVSESEFVLHFCPSPKARSNLINVLPDFVPEGRLQVVEALPVTYGGEPLGPLGFQVQGLKLLVNLPNDAKGSELQVRYKVPSKPAPRAKEAPAKPKGKIGFLVETHYVEAEIAYYREVLPQFGYEVVLLSYLWGAPEQTYFGNDFHTPLVVHQDITPYIKNPSLLKKEGFKGIILAAGYAMDRLRYELNPSPGTRNTSPAVEFLRVIDKDPTLVIGGVCHSMWLYCAAPDLLKGRKLTCAHNIMYDVQNAGGTLQWTAAGDDTVASYVDQGGGEKATLVTGRHPGVVPAFLADFLSQLE